MPKIPPPWPDRVECFLTPESGQTSVSLRRYVRDHKGGWECAEGWHAAMTEPIFFEPTTRVGRGDREVYGNYHSAHEFYGDSRWPTHCDQGCGYEFLKEDHWQVMSHALYRLPDGREVPNRDLPPGSMFDAWWFPESWKKDGVALSVVLPDGSPWNMDGPATGGGNWSRSGTPPNVTVTPSISHDAEHGGYHGHLNSGGLDRC